MSTSINIHCGNGLFLEMESPANSFALTLGDKAGTSVTFFLSRKNYILLRQLPKSADYSFVSNSQHVFDHAEADRLAAAFLSGAAPEPAPPADGEVR